ncbi:hypothetical protein Tco_0366016 [Tanacetum coccineum]
MNATSSKTDKRIDKLADQLPTLVEIVSKKVVTLTSVKAVEESCVTCGGAHSWYNCPATDNNQASVCATTGTYNQVNSPNRVSNQMAPPGFAPVQNNGQTRFIQNHVQGNNFNRGNNFHENQGTLPSNTIPNPKGEMNAITTRSGVAYEEPSIPTNPSPKKVVERETEETTDKEQINFQGSTAQILPPVIPISVLEPDVPTTLPKTIPIPESDIPKSLPKPNIPYPSRRDDQKFAPTIKSLLMNKEKLLELAKIPLNENCWAMLLKMLPEKLGDPGKFLIPCNFPRIDVCHTLAFLVQHKSYPLSFYLEKAFSASTYTNSDDFFKLILEYSLYKEILSKYPVRALIDVYGEEITLRVDNEAVTFNLDQTTRYSSTNDKSVNRIDIIDAVCEEYAPELLGFPNSSGGNPTPTSEPFTSEFILEEIEAYLKDDSISPEIDHADCNPEEDICLIEKLLNNDHVHFLRWTLNKVKLPKQNLQLKSLQN